MDLKLFKKGDSHSVKILQSKLPKILCKWFQLRNTTIKSILEAKRPIKKSGVGQKAGKTVQSHK